MAALSLVIVAGLVVMLIAASGSGRAGTAASRTSASTTVSGRAIGAGWIHSCALTSVGGIACWGWNGHDELGDGTVRYRKTPGDVTALSKNVRAIAIGSRHGCALTNADALKCWGYNRYGQLGDGTTTNSSIPVDVSGLSDLVTVAAASFHTCALESGGVVQCWGSNAYGELGDGTIQDRSTPVDVSGLGGSVTAIAAGDSHTCAVKSSGALKCWGDNSGGQLGDGTTVDHRTPVDVSGLAGVTAVAAGGFHSCALTSAGGVKCWGTNGSGQLGDGTRRNRSRPVDVVGLRRGVTAIATGLRHTCALTVAGGVKCWGLNDHGQLGDGRSRWRSIKPTDVFGLGRSATAIVAGALHSCALTRAGSVKCWGRNYEGELGDGTVDDRRRPVGVVGFGPAPATLAIVSRSTQATPRRVAAIKLRCGEAARCRGELTFSATVRGRLVGSPRSRVNVILAIRRFSVSHGRTASLRIRLNGPGFRLLVRRSRLRALVQITYAQPDGTTTATTGLITLIAPKV